MKHKADSNLRQAGWLLSDRRRGSPLFELKLPHRISYMLPQRTPCPSVDKHGLKRRPLRFQLAVRGQGIRMGKSKGCTDPGMASPPKAVPTLTTCHKHSFISTVRLIFLLTRLCECCLWMGSHNMNTISIRNRSIPGPGRIHCVNLMCSKSRFLMLRS